ncbi:MAG TPA: chorismate synthase [Bacteroidales bacterium]|nr:chorismate synthase [Bacteroidales bacterium]
MNTFGRIFRISLFGESHGEAIGVVIDGCPPGIDVSPEDFLADLERRRSGRKGTTPRKEGDIPEILSGIYYGKTTGAPVTIIARNTNVDSASYERNRYVPRPGHADYTALFKYSGYTDLRGGGHFSGRITWGLVAAGVIAKKILSPSSVNASLVEAGGSADIEKAVSQAMEAGDSIGGIIECRVSDPSKGLGEPFFYSAESAISQAVFSVPAIKGIEFGAGFRASSMRGSDHNDPFGDGEGRTLTNNSGGINGGITNGNELILRVAVKPTSSIGREQRTFDFEKREMTTLNVEGRHDTCIALRIPVIIEAAVSVALADLALIDRGLNRRVNN